MKTLIPRTLDIRILDSDYTFSGVVRSLIISENLNVLPFGSCTLEIEYKHEDLKHFVVGNYITIKVSDGSSFFGVLTEVSHTIQRDIHGVPLNTASLKCQPWGYMFQKGEFKQTLNREIGKLKNTSTSAIFKVSDYNEGILKVLREQLSLKDDPAEVLQQFINTLGHYLLPKNLGKLGQYIKVYDGSNLSDLDLYADGDTADIIQGMLLTQYQGAYVNNMSHWKIISQLFNTFSRLFELFCFTTTTDDPQNRFEEVTGLRLGIMYRYKPYNPKFPPTKAGLSKYTKNVASKYFFEDHFKVQSDAKRFRNLFPENITQFNYRFDESDHVNLVFIENPFANSDGHKHNMFRNNTIPVFDADDINKKGLRSFSTVTPFVPSKSSPQKKLTIQNALAERAYITFAKGSEFCTGRLTLVPVENDLPLPVGQWFSILDYDFYAYCTEVQKIYRMTPQGVLRIEYIYNYERGSFGDLIAFFEHGEISEEDQSTQRRKNGRKT